jgi:hypothetical protein
MSAKFGKLTTGIQVYNSSLGKMKLAIGLLWRATAAEEEFSSIGKPL